MKFLRAIAAALALLAAPVALADQSSIVQPTTGPHSLTDLMSNYTNPALRALLSNSSGTAAPANGPGNVPMSWQQWLNTSTNTMQIYDGAQWAPLYSVNQTTHLATWIGNLGQASTLANGVTGSGAVVLNIAPTINVRQSTPTLSPSLSPTFTLTSPVWSSVSGFYAGALFNLGGMPIGAMDVSQASPSTQTVISGLVGALNEPNCGANPAVYNTNVGGGIIGSSCPAAFVHSGVAGYSKMSNTTAAGVGLFGVSMFEDTGGASSGRTASLIGWGGNTICGNAPYVAPPSRSGVNRFVCYGWEFDVNVMALPSGAAPIGTIRGIAIYSGAEIKPINGAGTYGIEVGPFRQIGLGSSAAETTLFQSVSWDAGLVFGNSNGTAIIINSQGYGTGFAPAVAFAPGTTNGCGGSGTAAPVCGARNVGSQPIMFVSYDNTTTTTSGITNGGAIHTANLNTNPDGMFTFSTPIVQGPAQTECGSRKGIDLSVANTDFAITVYAPSANYVINAIRLVNPSVSLTTATFGLFSATGGGGAGIISGGTALSPLTTNAANAGGSLFQPTVNFNTNVVWNLSAVQFRVGTAQTGSGARTVDAYLYCIALQ